ncbi:MAG TPA: hypothetical protein VML19_07490 [Verrucomicrobiae bacterium]|nr:hypothetical protein [Verrucomicrobiae bacterium]
MTRRGCLTVIRGAIAVRSIVFASEGNKKRELLEASQNDKKSVMVYMKGQNVGGSREYSRIVVRMDAIDAVAMI